MKLKLATLAVLASLSVHAHADWTVNLDPSAFSDKEEGFISSVDGDDQSIIFDCEDETLSVSFIEELEEKEDEELDSDLSTAMRLKVGQETLDFGPTEIVRRNSHYVGIESKREKDAARALYMVRNAKGPITMGVKLDGEAVSLTVSPAGARKAADRIAKACGIDLTNAN